MHPNTEHLVVSLEDSLAVGGHFYCIDHMVKTLHALIMEHMTPVATNSSHPKSLIMVLQWTLAVRDRMQSDNVPRFSEVDKTDRANRTERNMLAYPSKLPTLYSLTRCKPF